MCGLNDERMQQKLLAIRDLTLETAIDTAVAMEAAVRSAKEIVGRNTLGNNDNKAGEIHRLGEGKGNYNNFQGGSKRECYRCGSSRHLTDICPFKSKECFNCGRIGHTRRKCMEGGGGKKVVQGKLNWEGVNNGNTSGYEEDDFSYVKYFGWQGKKA